MSLFRSNDGHFIFFWLLKYRPVCYMISVMPGKLEASDSWSLESALLTSGGNIYSKTLNDAFVAAEFSLHMRVFGDSGRLEL